VIISAVKLHQSAMGQVGNRGRIAPGFSTVRGVGKQASYRVLVHDRLDARERAFHFVVDHPDTAQLPGVRVELEVVAFLHEDLLAQKREEHRVAVDPQQIKVVLFHHAARRINSLVRKREGVEECLEAGLEQHDERIFEGEAFRAA
jgi:hypothetical protein